jgi:hypothetical protein
MSSGTAAGEKEMLPMFTPAQLMRHPYSEEIRHMETVLN